MDFKQLLTVGDSTNPSSSQLWFHLANLAIVSIYLFIGIKIGLLIGPDTLEKLSGVLDSLVFFTVVISGILTSNKLANVLINLRYGKKDDNSTDSK